MSAFCEERAKNPPAKAKKAFNCASIKSQSFRFYRWSWQDYCSHKSNYKSFSSIYRLDFYQAEKWDFQKKQIRLFDWLRNKSALEAERSCQHFSLATFLLQKSFQTLFMPTSMPRTLRFSGRKMGFWFWKKPVWHQKLHKNQILVPLFHSTH